MRFALSILVLFLAFTGHGLVSAENKPQRIASLNLCTDQILLMLVSRERIASITHLAEQPEYSFTWRQAQGLHKNSGLAEQIIPLQPDLIIASPYSPGSAVKLLPSLGFPVEIVEIPTSLANVEAFIRELGVLVGEPSRAAEIINTMQQKIARSEQLLSQQIREPMTAITYAPNGHTAGKNTLKNEILEKSGYRNMAADLGVDYYGNLSIEQLLYANPDLVVIDDSTNNRNSLAQRFTEHPVLKKVMGSSRVVHVDANQWLCAGPMAAEAIETLTTHRITPNNSGNS
ncbi:MAG: ABC transporter substrate-binding protein [Oceanicoccus sp.]